MDWKATALVLIAGLARSETQEAPKAARLAEHVVVRRYALVVGVETTKKAGVGRLEFAKKDAIDIAELLRTAGYVTRVLAAQEGDARNDPTLAAR